MDPVPDPITKDEIKITLGNWTADERTRIVIERQAKLMGFNDPTEFLVHIIAMTLADYELQTIQTMLDVGKARMKSFEKATWRLESGEMF